MSGLSYLQNFLFLTIPDNNECTLDTHNCDTNANCSNTAGSFTCACNIGYTGNGTSCSGKAFEKKYSDSLHLRKEQVRNRCMPF